MFVVVATAVITAIVLAIVLRFVGAFLRDPDQTVNALPFGALAGILTFLGGLALLQAIGHASWVFIFAPVIVALALAAFGGIIFGAFVLISWLTTKLDALANRGREMTDDYNFHRNLDHDE